MSSTTRNLNLNRLYYLVDLYAEKIDLGIKYYSMRIDAILEKDKEKAEFIENMFLKPADMQAKYVAQKIKDLFN